MLRKVEWSENRDYKTGAENEPRQFYIDALCNSTTFDLLLGYFSSTAINVLSVGFANFIYSGGKMRMVINNILSERDKEAVEIGQSGDLDISNFRLDDIKKLKSTLNNYGTHFFECLAFLIATNRIEIKIIQPKYGKGISHYKSGVFSDGINNVGFKASCNFTASGLFENLEELDCFLAWEDGRSNKWLIAQNNYFEKIFNEKADFVEYLDVVDIEIAIKKEFGNKNIDELLISAKELLQKKELQPRNVNLEISIEKANKIIDKYESQEKEPRFPFPNGPYQYQIDACNKWIDNDKKGLFAMATGTGKTLTSAYCLIEEFKNTGLQKNIIVVPGKELVEQWSQELKDSRFKRAIKWYSGNTNLNKDIEYIKLLKQTDFKELNIVITYKSFSSEKFLNIFSPILKDFIVVFDETHNMGANGFMHAINDLEFGKKIGLSATPLRLWDENNENQFIEDFFTSRPPYTFSYSMEEAIKNGFLCKYHYEPFFTTFSDDEWEEYLDLTRQLHITQENERINTRAALKRQLLKDQAVNKESVVLEIIGKLIENESYKNTLIYCQKGTNDDDKRYIRLLQNAIKLKFPQVNTATFVGETKDRGLLLKDFEDEVVHMLLAIKCLDEGVNIPKTMNAIFVASGQNYREFVQRRGRVLRNYKTEHFKKEFANIYDVVLLPTVEQFNRDRQTAERLIVSEFKRLYEFYNLATSNFTTYKKINTALEVYGLTEGYIRTIVNFNNIN